MILSFFNSIWLWVLSNYLELCFVLLSVLTVFVPKRFNIIKIFLGGIKKIMIRKYRTENYQDKNAQKQQVFVYEKPVYRLNKATNELEKTDEVIDIQALVNSCLDSCLNKALERLMPTVDNSSDEVLQLNSMQDDIDCMTEVLNISEFYKEKFGLDPKLSANEVFEIVKAKSNDLKNSIIEKQKVILDKEELKKEVIDEVIENNGDKKNV